MPKQQLRERLADLNAELERSPEVDDASRRQLAALADEIQEVLDRADAEEEHESLLERLTDAVREFEESHPQLSSAVGRVATTLSNLGI